MALNKGPRKEFADKVVQLIQSLAEEHGLKDVVVHRRANPMLIAARGCLEGTDDPVELAVLVSDNIAQAELSSVLTTEINEQLPAAQVYRSFDISEAVAKETAVAASPIEPKSPCDDDQQPDKPAPAPIE